MIKPIKLSKIDLFKEIFKDPDRKTLLKIIVEIFTLTFNNKGFPRYYFSRYLFKKDRENIMDYYSNKFLFSKIKPIFIDEEVVDVLENKLYFDFFYSQFNIDLPKILMYNHRKMFVVQNNYFEINNANDFKIQLENIFGQNPSHDSIIIKRTYGSWGGDKIFKIFLKQLTADPQRIEELYSEVIKSGFLFQETLKQHPELDRLNPSCLNTIRFDTFIDKDGNIEVISAYIRMSISNSHIDNIHAGGCMVGINLENGKLKKVGYPTIKYGAQLLTAHPITKTIFENFNLPYFNEAKELVLKIASLIPGLRLVGWDVAIGNEGPVLIEGNPKYGAANNDLTQGGYRSNSVFRKILTEINQ